MSEHDAATDDAAAEADCLEAIHTIYHYLDGELTAGRRADIQRHLDDCTNCLEAFDFEAELRILIARKCRDRIPDSLRDRIARAIAHESGEAGIANV